MAFGAIVVTCHAAHAARVRTQAQCVEYKMCVVGFAIRVDKGNNTKGGFDKKRRRFEFYADLHR